MGQAADQDELECLRRFGTELLFDSALRLDLEPQTIDGLHVTSLGAGAVIGRAVTTRSTPRATRARRTKEERQKSIAHLLEHILPDSVLVWTVDGTFPHSSFGGILGTAIHKKGARLIVLDGLHRDRDEIDSLPISVCSRGTTPRSGAGWFAAETQTPVRCGGATVSPGDIVAADNTGIVVLPRETDIARLVEMAGQLAANESRTLGALADRSVEEALFEIRHI